MESGAKYHRNRIEKGERMTIDEAIQLLKEFNAWRCGADTPMLNPREITEAINTVIAENDRWRDDVTTTTTNHAPAEEAATEIATEIPEE